MRSTFRSAAAGFKQAAEQSMFSAAAAAAWMLLASLALLLMPAAPAAAADAPRQPDGLLAVPPLARVTDLASVLPPEGKRVLEDKLAAFETARGSQIAVVVVPSTKPEPIADFTNRVGNAWKIGRKGVGDGVLIAVAVDDRRIWISVARALEGAIPDVTATRISREIIAPRFKQSDYAGGLSAGLDAIFKQIDNEGLPLPAAPGRSVRPAADDAGGSLAALIPLVVVGVLIGAVLKRAIGVPGSMLAGGLTGLIAGLLLASVALGLLAGFAALVLSLTGSARGAHVLGGRRGQNVFIPGDWTGGSSSWGGGRSSGGWSSGGGGDFSGGGGGSNW